MLTLSIIAEFGWHYVPSMNDIEVSNLIARLDTSVGIAKSGREQSDLQIYDAAIAPPGSMSSLIGAAPQPMHTDGAHLAKPPNYLVFQCLDAGSSSRPTLIWSLNHEAIQGPDFAQLRRIDWITSARKGSGFYCAIVEKSGSSFRLRYDPLCMRAVGADAPSAHEIEKKITSAASPVEIPWSVGGVLILDNKRCLHARGGHPQHTDVDSRKLRRWSLYGE